MIDSEIQFLLGLVLNHKLTGEVKKICLERIGKIEESLRAAPAHQRPQPVVQAPSMQRLLEDPPMPVASPIQNLMLPQGAKEIVTFQSPTGTTRGPSKVFR